MATTLSITPTRVIFGSGKFDSDNRYLRALVPGADFPIAQGVTLFVANASGNNQSAPFRYSVAGYTLESSSGAVSGAASYTLVST